DGSFERIGYAQRLTNIAEIPFCAFSVLHDRSPADHFEVSRFREIRQNFILNAIRKINVLFLIAQILERKNSNALFGNRGGRWFLSLPLMIGWPPKHPETAGNCDQRKRHRENDQQSRPTRRLDRPSLTPALCILAPSFAAAQF